MFVSPRRTSLGDPSQRSRCTCQALTGASTAGPNSALYQQLDGLAEVGKVAEAHTVFEELEDNFVKPTMLWNTMLKAYANAGQLDGAESWYNQMCDKQIRVNQNTYGKLIEASAKAETSNAAVAAADTWFRRMLENGFSPNIVTVTSLAIALVKHGATTEAQRWLDWSIAAGVRPDINYYNSMMAVCADFGDWTGAEAWMQRAIAEGHQPDAPTYGAAIAAAVNSGDHTKAENLLRLASKAKVVVDIDMYNAVISARAKLRDAVGAQEWLNRALGADLQPDIITYTAVVEACSRAGQMESAEAWVDAAVVAGLFPDLVMLGAIVTGYAKLNDLDAAGLWLRKTVGLGLQPDLVMYNVLVNGCAKTGDVEGAQGWIAEAEAAGLRPDVVTYTALLNAFAIRRDLEGARRVIDVHMAEAGVAPDAMTWSSFISACGRTQPVAVEVAEKAFTTMVRSGVAPTWMTLSVLERVVGKQRMEALCARLRVDVGSVLAASPQQSSRWRRTSKSHESNRRVRKLSPERLQMQFQATHRRQSRRSNGASKEQISGNVRR